MNEWIMIFYLIGLHVVIYGGIFYVLYRLLKPWRDFWNNFFYVRNRYFEAATKKLEQETKGQ